MDHYTHDEWEKDCQWSADGRSTVKWRNKPSGALHALARRLLRALPSGPGRPGYTSAETAAGVADHPLPAAHVTILLVGEQEGWVSALARTLEQEGYRVCTASSLAEALAGLWQASPALIVFYGHAIPEDWRALRQVTSVPVLALLSRPSDAAISGALEAGVDDCQATSMGTWETVSRVHALLRRGVI